MAFDCKWELNFFNMTIVKTFKIGDIKVEQCYNGNQEMTYRVNGREYTTNEFYAIYNGTFTL